MSSSKFKILVVEDEDSTRELLREILEAEYHVTEVESGEKAVKSLNNELFDLIITDLYLPGMNGDTVISKARESSPETPIIIITGYGTIENAVESIKKGVFNYLTKPVDKDILLLNVKRAIEFGEMRRKNINLSQEIQKKYSFSSFIGNSSRISQMIETVKKVSDSDATVLILGESGTGKELLAKILHYNSSRKGHPFIPVNCGAIPGELLESELFGHEKGAFTGAIASRIGRFERSQRGTIFLDEIGDMPLQLQVKLLRVLQERSLERVGGNSPISVDIRVIAATNKDLKSLTEKGTFRDDLYYRLNVIPICIPPLRERKEDIPELAIHFLHIMTRKKKRHIEGISPDALEMLMNYRWPGNIREMENIIERMVILKADNGLIVPEDLPSEISVKTDKIGVPAVDIPLELNPQGMVLPDLIDRMERRLINEALKKAGGVKSKAADALGINRTTLIGKMKKMGMLTDEQPQEISQPGSSEEWTL